MQWYGQQYVVPYEKQLLECFKRFLKKSNLMDTLFKKNYKTKKWYICYQITFNHYVDFKNTIIYRVMYSIGSWPYLKIILKYYIILYISIQLPEKVPQP